MVAHPSLDTILAESPRPRLAPGHFLFANPTTVEEAVEVACLLAVELDAVDMAGGNDRVSQVRQSRGGQN